MKTSLALILLFPLLGAIGNILAGRFLPRRAVEATACGVIWASFAATLAAAAAYDGPTVAEIGPWLSLFAFQAPIALYLDPLSLSLCLMITFVCGLIHLYSIGYMREDPGYVRYFALLNLFVFAMLLLVLAENLPLLYLGWEGVGFCSYALIGFWYREEKNATAGRKAFIVTRIGDVGFAIAIVSMFQLFDSLSITAINGMGGSAPLAAVTALGLLLLMGAMGKSAQAPLMVWLPDAMAGPTPVSAQIHAATMVTAGVYLLMRMFPLIGASEVVCGAIAATGVFTALYGASCALVERDLKRILAYSTISQIGYMMLGVGCGAITAATFHLLVHAFFKALLFLAAGCVITAMHHEQDILRMGGLGRRLPLTFWSFLVGALCLAGVPPSGGFFSKDSILTAAFAQGGSFYLLLYLTGLATVLLTAIYTSRLMLLVFDDRSDRRKVSDAHPNRLPKLMECTLIPLAVLALAGGLLNLPAYLGGGMLDALLAPVGPDRGHHEHATELLLQLLATGVSLAGIGLAWLLYGRKRRPAYLAEADEPASGMTAFLQKGWYVDDLYDLLFVRPYTWLAHILWQKVDEGLIDDSLDRMGSHFGRSGQVFGRWGSGRVSLYLLSLAGGAALMIAWFAWGVV